MANEEMYLPRTLFQTRTKMQSSDFEILGITIGADGVPMMATITALLGVYKQVRASMKKSGGTEDEATQLEIGFKQEKLTSMRIKNQTALSQLAPISVMKERAITTLTAYRQMVLLFIKDVANKLDGDSRKNEELITKIFNNLVDRVFVDIALMKEYEVDSNARLIMTRITNMGEESARSIEEELSDYDYDTIEIPELDTLESELERQWYD